MTRHDQIQLLKNNDQNNRLIFETQQSAIELGKFIATNVSAEIHKAKYVVLSADQQRRMNAEQQEFQAKMNAIASETNWITDTFDDIGALGLPIYGTIILGADKDYAANYDGVTGFSDGSEIQYTGLDGNTYSLKPLRLNLALINVTMTHNIVVTQIQGKKGTVKEYMGLGDYDITITGTFASPSPLHSPTDWRKSFHDLVSAPISMPVVSAHLNDIFNIHNIVIQPVDFPQSQGSYNSQDFTIHALSDLVGDVTP